MHICVEELESSLDRIENEFSNYQLFLIGDLNARTGSKQTEEEEILFENTNITTNRISLDEEINTRGRILINLLDSHGLYILNGRTPGDTPGSFTFLRGKAKTVIDYVCTNLTNMQSIQNLKTLEMPAKSDHIPLQLTVKPKWRMKCKPKKGEQYKSRTWLTWNEERKDDYQEIIGKWGQDEVEITKNSTASELYNKFTNKIKTTAELLKMKKYMKGKYKYEKNNWFNKTCKKRKET